MGGKDLFSIKKQRKNIQICQEKRKKKRNNFICKYKIPCIIFNFKVELEETNQFLGMAGRSITTEETSAFEDHVAIYNTETFAAQPSARNSCYQSCLSNL